MRAPKPSPAFEPSLSGMKPEGRRRFARGALAAMPVIAIALLAALVSVLIWYVERGENERLRASLLTDALWVEQALRFQLGTDEDALARLALDSGHAEASRESLLASARQMLANNPEMTSIVWVAANGRVEIAVPSAAEAPEGGGWAVLARRGADGTMRPVYGVPRRAEVGRYVVDMAIPVAGTASPGSALMATISLDALLARHVPWWIAEKYAVRLVDSDGQVLATKSRSQGGDDLDSHVISFDPPVPGISLRITPYSAQGNVTNTLLIASIFALAALAMLSFVVAHRHILRRLDAETALRAESAFRRAMEDSLTVGMRARDLEGRIIYVNTAFCRMVGMERDDLIGRAPPMPYWEPGDMERTVDFHSRVLAGAAPAEGFELIFRRKDGSNLDVLIYEAPLIDHEGNHAGWMASVLDITDRKRAEDLAQSQEASLQRTARLVTMGEMASTLAHELNQPLAAIASYAAGSLNLIRSGKVDTRSLAEALEKLGQQARRAGLIIRRVHDFVRKSDPKIVPTPVEQLVAESAAFAETGSRQHGVRLETRIAPGLPPALVDPILMQQVLLNLIRNGAEAMVTLPPAKRVLRISAALAGNAIEIAVEDRGPGLAEGLQDRLFEPFVTTKPDGMGMGLNICRSIVELHKGRLAYQPRPGGGLRFAVQVPIAAALEIAS
jgi:two-component system sensor histidine kinase DctS